jgi:xylan 1,4-beta-xylosidase
VAQENKSNNHEGHEVSRRNLFSTLLRVTSCPLWLWVVRLVLLALSLVLPVTAQDEVRIQVDAGVKEGPYPPVWAFFGYDESNYTYMNDGQKLLSELAALSPVPVQVRVHNLLTSGDGVAALKWGSTNAYTEDANGNPHYDWTIVDHIFDTFVARKMKPLVEIGFMPEVLSKKPEPYRHHWDPSQHYGSIFTGWAQPPRDYKKWSELVYQWVKHCVAKYGEKEVSAWYWEVWNEPDIGYWQGSPEEYLQLYDYSADAVKRALPAIRIGGPTSTGPGEAKAAEFLRKFLEHVVGGTNYATGKKGSPLDYITFHAKGRPKVVNGHVQMGSEYQLRDAEKGFQIVASFPELKKLPIIIGESDPEGCAACSVKYNPQNAYRNGTMYGAYTAATLTRIRELATKDDVNLAGAVTWAFEFEDQPYFAGFRDLATNGVDKPVLNVFRMFGLMEGDRVHAESSGPVQLEEMVEKGVKSAADVNAVATEREGLISVLAWNYHDDDVTAADAQVAMTIRGMPRGVTRVLVRRYSMDQTHSNSYAVWKSIGSPQEPTPAEYTSLERAGQLEMAGSPEWVVSNGGQIEMKFALARQAVTLIQVSW